MSTTNISVLGTGLPQRDTSLGHFLILVRLLQQVTNHSLTASDITVGAPSVDSPNLTGAFNLTEITAGAPIIDTPTLTAVDPHPLTANDITLGAPSVDSSTVSQVHSLLQTTINYDVTVVSSEGQNVFAIDGVNNPQLTLLRGVTYVFDVSDSSNSGHPLRFRDSSDTAYTSGVTASGTAGNANASVTFVVPSDAPASLKYYCTVHGNAMGNTISVENLGVVPSAPSIDSPTISIIHSITATDITTDTPVVDSSTITQAHELDNVFEHNGPTIDESDITQDHSFTVTEITTSSVSIHLLLLRMWRLLRQVLMALLQV